MGVVSISEVREEVEFQVEQRKSEAQGYFSSIKQAGMAVSKQSLRIGWNAYQLQKKNLFGILGFESESEAYEAAGVGASTWFANKRLAEDFDGLGEELFCKMKQANARELAKLPNSQRFDSVWLRKAEVDPIAEFASDVEVALNGKASAADGKERTVAVTLKMPASRKVAIEAGLKQYAEQVGTVGDDSKTLELLVAEHTGGECLMGAIGKSMEHIRAAKEWGNSDLSAGEVLEKVYAEIDEIVLLFGRAMETLQNLESASAE